ncbi:hypothetical protein ES705_15545 [subsurface metagenome]
MVDYTFVIVPWQNMYRNRYKRNKFAHVWKSLNLPELRDLDHKDFHGSILYEKLLYAVKNASIVIADISLGLPNVYWEMALAIAQNKPLILIRDKTGQTDDTEIKKKIEAFQKDKFIADAIKKYYSQASDISGLLYKKLNKLVNTDDQIKDLVYNKIITAFKEKQHSIITTFQFEKYLEYINKEERNYDLFITYTTNKDLFDFLEKREDQLTNIDKLYINFNCEYLIGEQSFKELIKEKNLFITFTNLQYRYIIFSNSVPDNFSFFSYDGNQYFYDNINSSYWQKIDEELQNNSYEIFSWKVLRHMFVLKKQLGLFDINNLKNNGFAFDKCSKLWIHEGNLALQYITEIDSGKEYRKIVEDEILENFYIFSEDYLEECEHIVAIWPLTEENILLAGNPSVKRWIKRIETWKTDITSKSRKVERFFIIPEETIQNSYAELQSFFIKDFNINKCSYLDDIYFLVSTNEKLTQIFIKSPGDVRLANENTILFSKNQFNTILKHDNPQANGVLQTEDHIQIPGTGQRITNLRYCFVSENYRRYPRTTELIDELNKLYEAKNKGVSLIIKYEPFKEKYLNK